MAITFFGVATTPADNSASAGPTVTLTPPGSMVDGDLVFVSVRYRDSAATIADAPSNTGGQDWQLTTQYNRANVRARVFWCRFNGTWSANPAFTVTSGTNNMDAQMLVFRPTSAAHTWSIESGPNDATYAAPSTPFTVTITGRDTTAASTVSIACWHSIDDNSWGSLSGSGWSKTSLGAQYRNNSTADNSSSFAYCILTSAGATNDVSQNQSALGGDAGSTALFTFAETLVTAVLEGVAGTLAAGSLAIAQTVTGLAGLESTASAGDIVIAEAGGSNATGTPSGVVATASAGTAGTIISPVVTPSGAGVGAAAGTLLTHIGAAPSAVSASASVGTITAVGGTPSEVPVGGVSATAEPGSLGIAVTQVGVEGAESTAAVGLLSASGGGIVHAAGQPSTVFATAQAGGLAVSPLSFLSGVVATLTAEEISAGALIAEIDGVQGALFAGSVVPLISAPLFGAEVAAAVGTLAPIATVIRAPTGVESISTVGNLTGVTAGAGTAAPGGVSASTEVGTLSADWTFDLTLTGIESTAAAGAAAVEGGDSISDEAFPAGVSAAAQVGAISTGEARAAVPAVSITTQVGTLLVSGEAAVPLDKPDAIRFVPVLDATISIEPALEANVRMNPVT